MKTTGPEKEAGTAATVPAKEQGKQTVPTDTIGAWVEKHKGQLEKALPRHFTADRFARVFLTAIRMNPKLAQADFVSLLGAMMASAQLGLEPNTPLGQCYLIPYANKKTGKTDVQFQLGYKGIIDLCHRSRMYKSIYAHAVDEADFFDYEYGLDQKLIHKPAKTPKGNSVYYYAVYRLDNGGSNFTVWSYDKVLAHAMKYSQSWDATAKAFKYGSAWASSFDSMALKTVLIDVLKFAPKSVELDKAVNSDNRTIVMNPDDPDMTTETINGDFELTEGAV